MTKVIDFKVPKNVCLYCGEEAEHPGFSCPRIARVIHSEEGWIAVEMGDDGAEVELLFDE